MIAAELPSEIHKALPDDAKTVFLGAFNNAIDYGCTQNEAYKAAWRAVDKAGYKRAGSMTYAIGKKREDDTVTNPLHEFNTRTAVIKARDGLTTDEAMRRVAADDPELYRAIEKQRRSPAPEDSTAAATPAVQLDAEIERMAREAMAGNPDLSYDYARVAALGVIKPSDVGGGPEERLRSVAKSMRQLDPKLTEPAALDRAIKRHPSIYGEYKAQKYRR